MKKLVLARVAIGSGFLLAALLAGCHTRGEKLAIRLTTDDARPYVVRLTLTRTDGPAQTFDIARTDRSSMTLVNAILLSMQQGKTFGSRERMPIGTLEVLADGKTLERLELGENSVWWRGKQRPYDRASVDRLIEHLQAHDVFE